MPPITTEQQDYTVRTGESYFSIARRELGSGATGQQVAAFAEAIAAQNGGLGVLKANRSITIPGVQVSEGATPSIGFMQGSNALTQAYGTTITPDTVINRETGPLDIGGGYGVNRFGGLFRNGPQTDQTLGGLVQGQEEQSLLRDGVRPASAPAQANFLRNQTGGSPRPFADIGENAGLVGAGNAGRPADSLQLEGAPASQTRGADAAQVVGTRQAPGGTASPQNRTFMDFLIGQNIPDTSSAPVPFDYRGQRRPGDFTSLLNALLFGTQPGAFRPPDQSQGAQDSLTKGAPVNLPTSAEEVSRLSSEDAARIPRQYLPDLINAQQSARSIPNGEFPPVMSENARIMLGYDEVRMGELGYVREGNRWLGDPVAQYALQYEDALGGGGSSSGGGGGYSRIRLNPIGVYQNYASSSYALGYSQPRGGGSLGYSSGYNYVSDAAAGLVNWRITFG